MGSATRDALHAAKAALSALSNSPDLAIGSELLAAGRLIGESAQLRSVLSDTSTEAKSKAKIIDRVFGALGTTSRGLLHGLVGSRWSNQSDLLAGIEEVGFRVLAVSAADSSAKGNIDIAKELFAFANVVGSSAELELALGSKLGDPLAKVALVHTLLEGKASKQTVAIVSHLVQQPRGRRIAALLTSAAKVVADQFGLTIATVTSATPLNSGQLSRLQSELSASYGRELKINLVVDPELIGGVRVRLGDDIIDGSIATRLSSLKLQLAG